MAKKRISSSEAEIRRFIKEANRRYRFRHLCELHLDANDVYIDVDLIGTGHWIRVSLREIIEKRQSLKGVKKEVEDVKAILYGGARGGGKTYAMRQTTKRLRKAIRGKKK